MNQITRVKELYTSSIIIDSGKRKIQHWQISVPIRGGGCGLIILIMPEPTDLKKTIPHPVIVSLK